MLTIGQFSKVCKVSVKALHHYDKIGLMHPDSVDRWTGYRYYDESQISTMLLIQRLKRYGFSLSEIGGFLEDPDQSAALFKLGEKRAELLNSIEETARIVREMEQHIENLERTGNMMSYQNTYKIELETTEKMPILSNRKKMSIKEFDADYGGLFERAARGKIQTNGAVMAIYHDEEFNPECSDIELALGVTNPENATRVLPGYTAATTIHRGSYANLSESYGAIMRWITDNGYQVADAPFEIYLKTQFDHVPPEEWETKILFPVRKA